MAQVLADPLSHFQQGFGNALATGQQVQQMNQRNALADLYRTQGQGIAQGDAQALNALAQLDPMAAMDVRRTQAAEQRANRGLEMDERRLGMAEESHGMGMKLNKQQLEEARAAGQRAAQTHAAQMDAITRQREAEEINAALSSAGAAYSQGPEAFEAWKAQNAEMIAAAEMDPAAVTYDAFPGIAAGLIGASEGLLAGLETGQAMTAGPSQTVSRVVTGEEAAALGLDPGAAYNVTEGPEGTKASAIGGGGTSVSVDLGGDEFEKAVGKKNADFFGGIADGGATVPAKLAQVDELDYLLGNTEGGAATAVKAWLGNFGVETEGLSDIQAAEALISRLVPEQRQAGSGPMSDADLALFKKSLPRLINTKEGNQQIARTMRGLLIYQQQQAEIANQVMAGGISPTEGRSALMALQNPLQVYRRDGEAVIGGYTIREVTE